MKGTEKQVAWAMDIKAECMEALDVANKIVERFFDGENVSLDDRFVTPFVWIVCESARYPKKGMSDEDYEKFEFMLFPWVEDREKEKGAEYKALWEEIYRRGKKILEEDILPASWWIERRAAATELKWAVKEGRK